MHASQFAAAAYQKSAQTVGAPQATEYQAFQRATVALKAAAAEDAAPNAMAAAVHMNNRLWNVLAVDLADERNQLPQALRAQLLSLAVFSVRHGQKVMEGDETVEPLISINNAVMSGLSASLKRGVM